MAIGYTCSAGRWWRTADQHRGEAAAAHAGPSTSWARSGWSWHTDIRNVRSQAAIERLGATREGVLRRHKQRADGSWRDTVHYAMTVDEWPTAQATAAGKTSRTAPVA